MRIVLGAVLLLAILILSVLERKRIAVPDGSPFLCVLPLPFAIRFGIFSWTRFGRG